MAIDENNIGKINQSIEELRQILDNAEQFLTTSSISGSYYNSVKNLAAVKLQLDAKQPAMSAGYGITFNGNKIGINIASLIGARNASSRLVNAAELNTLRNTVTENFSGMEARKQNDLTEANAGDNITIVRDGDSSKTKIISDQKIDDEWQVTSTAGNYYVVGDTIAQNTSLEAIVKNILNPLTPMKVTGLELYTDGNVRLTSLEYGTEATIGKVRITGTANSANDPLRRVRITSGGKTYYDSYGTQSDDKRLNSYITLQTPIVLDSEPADRVGAVSVAASASDLTSRGAKANAMPPQDFGASATFSYFTCLYWGTSSDPGTQPAQWTRLPSITRANQEFNLSVSKPSYVWIASPFAFSNIQFNSLNTWGTASSGAASKQDGFMLSTGKTLTYYVQHNSSGISGSLKVRIN